MIWSNFWTTVYSSTDDIYEEVKKSRDFTGKVVLVTGSSGGIGAQTVKLFSALGASVVVTGRKEDVVRKVGQEVQRLSPKGLKVKSYKIQFNFKNNKILLK